MTDPTPTEIIASHIRHAWSKGHALGVPPYTSSGRTGADAALAQLAQFGYRIVRVAEVHEGYDGDTVLGRAARHYLAVGGCYSRRGMEEALIGIGLDPGAPWRNAGPTPDPRSPDRPSNSCVPVGNPSSGTDRPSDESEGLNRRVAKLEKRAAGMERMLREAQQSNNRRFVEVNVRHHRLAAKVRDAQTGRQHDGPCDQVADHDVIDAAVHGAPPVPTQTTAEVLDELKRWISSEIHNGDGARRVGMQLVYNRLCEIDQ